MQHIDAPAFSTAVPYVGRLVHQSAVQGQPCGGLAQLGAHASLAWHAAGLTVRANMLLGHNLYTGCSTGCIELLAQVVCKYLACLRQWPLPVASDAAVSPATMAVATVNGTTP